MLVILITLRYCGVTLNANGWSNPAQNTPIISCELPFELSHVTGITSLSGTTATNPNTGFQITYSKLLRNC